MLSALFLAVAPALGIACGSTSSSVTAPSGTKCSVAAANDTPQLSASGGNGTVTVSTTRDCTWTASTDASWIALGATGGQGPGTLQYVVQANAAGTSRHGRLTVAEQAIDVAQAPAACRYAVSEPNVSVDASGQQMSVGLTATDGCQWTVRGDAPWIAGAAPPGGTGSATIQITISANTGGARAANVTIGGATVHVTQAAPGIPPTAPVPAPAPQPPSPSPNPPPRSGCSASLKPTWYTAGRGPDRIQIGVTADRDCTWTAASTVSWATVAQGASGSGAGTVELVVQPNSGATRSVTLTIAGQPFALTQEGPH